MYPTPERIVSGGQTGADRAALDWAIEHGIKHGGFCPRGRKAEDGIIPERYRLIQTRLADLRERTAANVKAGDATLVFIGTSKLGGGSRVTVDFCISLNKPHLIVTPKTTVDQVAQFLTTHQPKVLNVAGTRASKSPDIYKRVKTILTALFFSASPAPTHTA
jgi:hypothetical protein